MNATTAPVSPPSLRGACECAGINTLDLAGLIYDRLRHLRPEPAPPATLEVLRVLLIHANRDHDRVFASQVCLAGEAGLHTNTVGPVLAFLRRVKAIRTITGQELREGDGPHRARDRGHKPRSEYPTDTHDLSNLRRFLPGWLLRLLSPLKRHDTASVSDVDLENPFESEPAPPPAPAEGFEPQKSGGTKKEETSAHWEAVQKLRGIGLRGPVPQAICATLGPQWAGELVAYHAWRTRRGDPVGPGYLVGIWKEWRQNNGAWPDDFAHHQERERMHAARIRPPAVEVAARHVPKPDPPVRTEGTPHLDALGVRDPVARRELESRALSAVLATVPPPLAAILQRRGIAHAQVRALAEQMARDMNAVE